MSYIFTTHAMFCHETTTRGYCQHCQRDVSIYRTCINCRRLFSIRSVTNPDKHLWTRCKPCFFQNIFLTRSNQENWRNTFQREHRTTFEEDREHQTTFEEDRELIQNYCDTEEKLLLEKIPCDIEIAKECCVCSGSTTLLAISCRHVVCFECIQQIIKIDKKCPLCRNLFEKENLRKILPIKI